MFDVEELPTHGGSLRIYAKHKEDNSKEISTTVDQLLQYEISKGINDIKYYDRFQEKAEKIKLGLLQFLIAQKNNGKKVAGYGAAAKGNTLLNYCGVKNDLIEFVADANPHKQGKFLPASHIPVVDEKRIKDTKPHYILILPWNIKEEICNQLSYIRDWNGKFITAIPSVNEL
jgi:hypothetical protein